MSIGRTARSSELVPLCLLTGWRNGHKNKLGARISYGPFCPSFALSGCRLRLGHGRRHGGEDGRLTRISRWQLFDNRVIKVFIGVDPGHAASSLLVFPDGLVDLFAVPGVVIPCNFQVGRRQVRMVFQDAAIRQPHPLPFHQAVWRVSRMQASPPHTPGVLLIQLAVSG